MPDDFDRMTPDAQNVDPPGVEHGVPLPIGAKAGRGVSPPESRTSRLQPRAFSKLGVALGVLSEGALLWLHIHAGFDVGVGLATMVACAILLIILAWAWLKGVLSWK